MFGGQASPDPPVQLTWNVLDVTDTLDVSNFVHPSRLPFWWFNSVELKASLLAPKPIGRELLPKATSHMMYYYDYLFTCLKR